MADPQFNQAGWDWLLNQLERIRNLTKEASKPSGSQVIQAAQKILEILNNIDSIVSQSISNNSYTRSQIDSKDQNTLSSANSHTDSVAAGKQNTISILETGHGGTGTNNAYNRDVGSVTRRATWMDENGALGYALSTERGKKNIVDATITEAVLRSIKIVNYQFQNDDDDSNPQIGVTAEQVEGLVPESMMYRDADGQIEGVELVTFGILALRLGQMNADRIDKLEQRIQTLETKEQ